MTFNREIVLHGVPVVKLRNALVLEREIGIVIVKEKHRKPLWDNYYNVLRYTFLHIDLVKVEISVLNYCEVGNGIILYPEMKDIIILRFKVSISS